VHKKLTEKTQKNITELESVQLMCWYNQFKTEQADRKRQEKHPGHCLRTAEEHAKQESIASIEPEKNIYKNFHLFMLMWPYVNTLRQQ